MPALLPDLQTAAAALVALPERDAAGHECQRAERLQQRDMGPPPNSWRRGNLRESDGNGALGADSVDAEVMRLAGWKLANGGHIHAVTPFKSAVGKILVASDETAIAGNAQDSSLAAKCRAGRNLALPLECCFILSTGHDFCRQRHRGLHFKLGFGFRGRRVNGRR